MGGVIAGRLAKAREAIKEIDNFPWVFHEKTYYGIPLKHFVDNFHGYDRIKHDSACPNPFHEPYFFEMIIQRGNNTITAFTPPKFTPFAEDWNQWHKPISKDKLENLPLKHNYRYEFTHTNENPPPLMPAKVQQEQDSNLYMVSPEHAFISMQNFGKGYTFADRIVPESIIEIKQEVLPGFHDETDPATKLKMLRLHVKCSARINVLKSLGLLKGTVLGKAETEMRKTYNIYFENIEDKLKDTCEQRL